jgi:hypothetical protein
MRLASLLCLLLALAGISAAQGTNFPTGPQYLITSDSPLFLRSIATPTLSLSAPLASISASATETSVSTETSSPSAGLPTQPDLTRIYWGGPAVTENVSGTVSESIGQNVSQSVGQNVSEIEISSAQLPSALPASILDVGVTGMTSAQSLRERGYGVPLGDTAAFWKAHKRRAARVYTNADVQRLHPS